MSDEKIIVLVGDRGDSKHGEISVLDDPQKAERLVETLLEAGFEEDRIRVFSGRASDFQVSHRPVVALVGEGEGGAPQSAGEIEDREAVTEQPPADEPGADAVAAEAQAAPAEAKSDAAEVVASETQEEAPGETNEEEEAPEASEATAVRFSSLFRSA